MLHSHTGTSPGLPFPNPSVTGSLATPAKCHRQPGAKPFPGERSWLEGGGVIPALSGTMQGCGIRGEEASTVSVRSLATPPPPRPSIPPGERACPGSVPITAASGLSSYPRGRGARGGGAAGGRGGMGLPRLCFWTSFPGAVALGSGPRCGQRVGCGGGGCSRVGAGSPRSLGPTEPLAGQSRSRPCLRAPFALARAAAAGCLWPEGAS